MRDCRLPSIVVIALFTLGYLLDRFHRRPPPHAGHSHMQPTICMQRLPVYPLQPTITIRPPHAAYLQLTASWRPPLAGLPLQTSNFRPPPADYQHISTSIFTHNNAPLLHHLLLHPTLTCCYPPPLPPNPLLSPPDGPWATAPSSSIAIAGPQASPGCHPWQAISALSKVSCPPAGPWATAHPPPSAIAGPQASTGFPPWQPIPAISLPSPSPAGPRATAHPPPFAIAGPQASTGCHPWHGIPAFSTAFISPAGLRATAHPPPNAIAGPQASTGYFFWQPIPAISLFPPSPAGPWATAHPPPCAIAGPMASIFSPTTLNPPTSSQHPPPPSHYTPSFLLSNFSHLPPTDTPSPPPLSLQVLLITSFLLFALATHLNTQPSSPPWAVALSFTFFPVRYFDSPAYAHSQSHRLRPAQSQTPHDPDNPDLRSQTWQHPPEKLVDLVSGHARMGLTAVSYLHSSAYIYILQVAKAVPSDQLEAFKSFLTRHLEPLLDGMPVPCRMRCNTPHEEWHIELNPNGRHFAQLSQQLNNGGGYPVNWPPEASPAETVCISVLRSPSPLPVGARQLQLHQVPPTLCRANLDASILTLAGYTPVYPPEFGPPETPPTGHVLLLQSRLGYLKGSKGTQVNGATFIIDFLPPADDPFLRRLPPGLPSLIAGNPPMMTLIHQDKLAKVLRPPPSPPLSIPLPSHLEQQQSLPRPVDAAAQPPPPPPPWSPHSATSLQLPNLSALGFEAFDPSPEEIPASRHLLAHSLPPLSSGLPNALPSPPPASEAPVGPLLAYDASTAAAPTTSGHLERTPSTTARPSPTEVPVPLPNGSSHEHPPPLPGELPFRTSLIHAAATAATNATRALPRMLPRPPSLSSHHHEQTTTAPLVAGPNNSIFGCPITIRDFGRQRLAGRQTIHDMGWSTSTLSRFIGQPVPPLAPVWMRRGWSRDTLNQFVGSTSTDTHWPSTSSNFGSAPPPPPLPGPPSHPQHPAGESSLHGPVLPTRSARFGRSSNRQSAQQMGWTLETVLRWAGTAHLAHAWFNPASAGASATPPGPAPPAPTSSTPEDEDDAVRCPICWDSSTTNEWTSTACNHNFHTACLERWLAPDGGHTTCPVCRFSLRLDPTQEPGPTDMNMAGSSVTGDDEDGALQEALASSLTATTPPPGHLPLPPEPSDQEMLIDTGEPSADDVDIALQQALEASLGTTPLSAAGAMATPLPAPSTILTPQAPPFQVPSPSSPSPTLPESPPHLRSRSRSRSPSRPNTSSTIRRQSRGHPWSRQEIPLPAALSPSPRRSNRQSRPPVPYWSTNASAAQQPNTPLSPQAPSLGFVAATATSSGSPPAQAAARGRQL